MPNYYEMLQIPPTSTIAEVQCAYETQYNQWRRLVTHHDPATADQANQAVRLLETIRDTLTDPAKRAGYDAGIGIGGVVSGLADPTALLQSLQQPVAPAPGGGAMAPPSPKRSAASSSPAGPPSSPGLWACGKCHTDNPPPTKFCFKCGAQLVRECPECQSDSSLIATGMCGSCGYGYAVATRRKAIREELKHLAVKLAELQQELVMATQAKPGGPKKGMGVVFLVLAVIAFLSEVKYNPGSAVANLVFFGAIGMGFWLWGNSARNKGKAKVADVAARISETEERQRKLERELKASTISRN